MKLNESSKIETWEFEVPKEGSVLKDVDPVSITFRDGKFTKAANYPTRGNCYSRQEWKIFGFINSKITEIEEHYRSEYLKDR